MDVRWLFLSLVVFEAQSVLCDPYHLHGVHGTFTSPNFPETYGNNLLYNWTIKVPSGYRVALRFTSFDLEDSELQGVVCSADYIQIFDGDLTANVSSKRLCGNPQLYPDDAPDPSAVFRSTSSEMTVRFVSDYSNDLPGYPPPSGFRATFVAEDIDECEERKEKYLTAVYPERVGKCDHRCVNYLGGFECTCDIGYELASDGYTCKGKCSNMQYYDRVGDIRSPGYPNNYPKGTDCDWTIHTDIGNRISLNFVGDFDIEDYHPDYPKQECPYDYLKIIDGENSIVMCGNSPEFQSYVSASNLIQLKFHSDMVKELTGFHVSYKVTGVYCDNPDPPAHGRISEAYGAINGRLPYESVVVFECEFGYEMQGEHKITCLKDGSFDDRVPTCTRIH